MSNGADARISLEQALGPFDPSQADRVIAREVDSIARAGARMEKKIDDTATRLETKVDTTAAVLYRRLWWLTTAVIGLMASVIVALVATLAGR